MTVNNKVTVMAGVIDPDYTGEIKVILYNYGTKPYDVHPRAKIAQLILEKFESIPTEIVPDLRETERGEKRFGSTDIGTKEMQSTIELDTSNPQSCAAKTQLPAKIRPNGIIFDMNGDGPVTELTVVIKGNHPSLGFDLIQDNGKDLILASCLPGTSAEKYKNGEVQ